MFSMHLAAASATVPSIHPDLVLLMPTMSRRRDLEASLKGDGATDVLTVLRAERVLDVAANCVQLSRERLDIRVVEMGVFGYFGDGHRGLPA